MASETHQANSDAGSSLLTADDPSPVRIVNPKGASSFLLIGDHAGNRVPSMLGSMGLSNNALERHIAWDVGTVGLGVQLAVMLDAVFIRQVYSRLVIDCNRDPSAPDAIPAISDGTIIPANEDLNGMARLVREVAIHRPYQDAIAREVAKRDAAGRRTILVSLHSFTPSMDGFDRPWEIGILHGGGDTSFAKAVLRSLAERGDLIVGDNEPYAMDGIDHTIPLHAFADARHYVEIEVRQDLLVSDEQQVAWARLIADAVCGAPH
jgi:predicted N-formylglutamate amidohydrolase